MKYYDLLFLVLVMSKIPASSPFRPTKKCNDKNGKCLSSATTETCRRLPMRCDKGKICCKREDIPGDEEKVKKACKESLCGDFRGVCQVKKNKTRCKEVSIPELCIGLNCTCCIKGNDACKTRPRCHLRGGICLQGRKRVFQKAIFKKGDFIDNGCGDKNCRCYVPSNSKCNCGSVNQVRVIGGKEVNPINKYPWVVTLKRKRHPGHLCGGTVINSRYILTAAHCLHRGKKLLSPKSILVHIANHDYKSKEDNIKGVTRRRSVKEFVFYPGYDSDLHHHDIALLHLKEDLPLFTEEKLGIACLPTTSSKSYAGKMGVGFGWGVVNMQTYEMSSVLKEVALPILDTRCNGILVSEQEITEMMLCAGGEEGQDTCEGDSGGPLTVKENGRHVLVGLVSFGKGCAKKGMPAVYTRVSKYLGWIVENTKDAYYCS